MTVAVFAREVAGAAPVRGAPAPWRAPGSGAVSPLAGARARLALLMVALGVATLAVMLRLVWLAIVPHAEPAARAATWASPRADLVDRNGMPLARGVESYAVVVRPRELVQPRAALAAALARITGRDVGAIARGMAGAKPFYAARRAVPDVRAAVVALGEPGIEFEPEPARMYPQGSLAAQTVGYVDLDGHGSAGLERGLDARLGRGGAPVVLAMDARVQQALESELGAGVAKYSAKGAAGIVLDVRTGEVVALASLPTFDANRGGNAGADAMRNRATFDRFELGSTFKALTTAMALDSGAARLDSVLDARAPLHIARYTIHDDHPKARMLSLPEVFIYSSNIGTARLAQAIGPGRQQAYLGRMGMLDLLPSEVPERGRPLVPAQWGELATMTIGYGHGLAVTPLHLAAAYAALVNGGVWRAPTFLRASGPRPGVRVFKPETSEAMRRLLRLVVLKGTGRKGDAPGYRIGAKTGTADKPHGGGYDRRAVVSTFAAVFPVDQPRYVVIAMLDTPHGTADTFGHKEAGWNAAPVVKRVVERVGPMLGVAPDLKRDVETASLLGQVEEARD